MPVPRRALARILPTWPPGPASGAHLVDPVVVLGEAVLALLRVLSADRRTVLVLDDAHWADRDTLALLEYLAGGLHDVASSIVVAMRDDQAGPDGLAALRRHPRVRTVVLEPLRPAEVAVLARRTVGGELPPEAEEYVTRVSEGVPLMVTEVTTGLVDRGVLVRDGPAWRTTRALSGGPPPSHSALVDGRVAGLTPRVRELVRTAAVLGPAELDPQLLARVAGDVVEELPAAVDAGLLIRGPAGELRWRHALTCSAVLAGLTAPGQAAVAARAAAALDGAADVPRSLVAANLRERGGRPVRAAGLLLEEARDASLSAPCPPRTRYSDVPPCWPWGRRACSWRSPSNGSRRSPWPPAPTTRSRRPTSRCRGGAGPGGTGRRRCAGLRGRSALLPGRPLPRTRGRSRRPAGRGARRPHRARRR